MYEKISDLLTGTVMQRAAAWTGRTEVGLGSPRAGADTVVAHPSTVVS